MQPQKIVIAPDKFKGSLSAAAAARAIARGIRSAVSDAEIVECPMADGGEGTVDAFLTRGAKRETAKVHGPLGEIVEAAYAVQGQTAILEMASASGLGLLQAAQYDPARSNTFGTGELILAALGEGVTRLIIGVGGSATNDAGVGMLRALGVRFLDADGNALNGSVVDYMRLKTIDLRNLDSRMRETAIDVATDVTNPLCGPDGASRTFATQKGATPGQVAQLEAALDRIATIAEQTLHRRYRDTPGAGAAGGLGFALIAFLGARLLPGAGVVARECGLERLLDGAALCITGEGKIDLQTLHGKTVYYIAQLAKKKGVPAIAFGGVVDPQAAAQLKSLGIEALSISPPGTPAEESMRSAAHLLERAARETAARVKAALPRR